MRRALRALFLLLPMAAYGQVASPFTFYIIDPTGVLPDAPLPAGYHAADTPVGGSSPTFLKMVNSSPDTAYFVGAFMSIGPTFSRANPNFSVTGQFVDDQILPGDAAVFTVNFTPGVTGSITSFLNIEFQIQQNTCTFTSSVNGCPSGFANVSQFTGIASAPQWTLSYQSATGSVVLLPSSASPLTFPVTSLSASSTITFTLTNDTSVDATAPAISLPTVDQYAASAFTLDTSGWPTTIAAGQSASFSVAFAPGQAVYTNGVLQVGSNSYPIAGDGIISTAIDSLQISYTGSTGVRISPQAATPIDFGQLVSGSGSNIGLTFSLTLNPNASATSVLISSIAVSGAAFSLSGLPTLPITITSQTVTFSVVFTPTATGNSTGALSIGGRTFSLTGGGLPPPFPGATITLGAPPIGSDQQATVSVQLSPPLSSASVLTLMMQFAPSVTGAADNSDAAIALGTGGSQLTLNLAANSTTATYTDTKNVQQSAIPFETGTTEGTITFSLTFLGYTFIRQPFTINHEPAHIAVEAKRESPNLLVTVTGYDNTYSAGALSFTFYDTSGKLIGNAFQHDESAGFQQLFFTNNTKGGLFSLQASFPVITGDVTQVGSVAVGVTNSVGQALSSANFQ